MLPFALPLFRRFAFPSAPSTLFSVLPLLRRFASWFVLPVSLSLLRRSAPQSIFLMLFSLLSLSSFGFLSQIFWAHFL
jgi:hypothetical protein